MKRDVLSLKGIYQVLFVNDYPVFSTGIIAKSKHIGLTLTKFWQENLLPEFKAGRCGKIIWRTEGGRNRYISEICNRSERLSVYGDYAQELYVEANAETIQKQIEQFAEFLSEKDYNYVVFMQKFDAYIKLLGVNDKAFTPEMQLFFADAMEYGQRIGKRGEEEKAFFCGWLLSFLTLHALSGNGEGEESLQKLRNNKMFSLEYLYDLFCEEHKYKKAELILWASEDSELCKEPLECKHFFGREEELFELDEMLERGGKYLVSGVGGIGKTELMRQFIKYCKTEKDLDYICVIQYKGSMRDSLISLFPKVAGADADERLQEAMAVLKSYEGQKGLIVVDNVTNDMQTDAEIGLLLHLSTTVFMTTRFSDMPGFEVYSVNAIGKKAGSLIFRDNYGRILSGEEKQKLEELLDNPMWCHSLTLRLLGRIANVRGLSLSEFMPKLQCKEKALVGDTGNELKRIYQQMFSTMDLHMYEPFLHVFALLPYGSYRTEVIHKYFGGFFASNQSIKKALKELCHAGLLEHREGGYSMHPFVAECVLPEKLDVEALKPFMDMISGELNNYYEDYLVGGFEEIYYTKKDEALPISLVRIIRLVPNMMKYTTGTLQEKYFGLVLLALYMEYNAVGRSTICLDEIVALCERTKKYSAKINLCREVILLLYGYDKKEDIERLYHIIKDDPDVSDLYKDLLLNESMTRLFLMGEYKLVEEMSWYNWENGVSINARMRAASLLAIFENQRGDIAKMEQWIREGIAVGENAGNSAINELSELQLSLFGILMSRREFEEAEQIVKRWRKRVETGNTEISYKWMYLYSMGMLKSHREDANHGIAELSAAVELADKYMIDRQSCHYLNSLTELALACQKAHIWEKSEEYYDKVLQECSGMMGQEFNKGRILNNAGVMYLNWGKYDKALEYLEESYRICKPMGGLFVGESTNNISKVWRNLGNRKKELRYLQEALPILESFYGPEHPKVIDAKERMAE